MITPDRLASWRLAAAALTGVPVGKALREACDEIEELQTKADRTVQQASDHIGDTLRRLEEAVADRDRARDAAVALEQENARLIEELGQARLDEQEDAMATAGAFDDEEPF